jgi:hypothetical protein
MITINSNKIHKHKFQYLCTFISYQNYQPAVVNELRCKICNKQKLEIIKNR